MKPAASNRVQPWLKTAAALAVAVYGSAAARADDDEARFKTRTHAPGKSLNDTAYRAPVYTPSRASAPVGAPVQETSSGSRWRLFTRKPAETGKPAETAKLAPGGPLLNAAPYTQQKHISVPTIKADPRAIQERKPLITSDKDIFTPAEKSEWKNPLLKPRQGIKEHVE